jgi:hypothetical protein
MDKKTEKWIVRVLYHLLCCSDKSDIQYKLVNKGIEILKELETEGSSKMDLEAFKVKLKKKETKLRQSLSNTPESFHERIHGKLECIEWVQSRLNDVEIE